MIKELLKLGNPQLYEISSPITEEDLANLPQWVEDLHDTLMEYRRVYGAGRAVAAPQIGIQKRLLYMYLDKAYVDYCNVIDLDAKNTDALQFRAYIYMRRRQYQEAKNDYQSLLEVLPDDKTARIGIAMVNQKMQRFREALEEFNRLIVDYPKDASLLKARAELEIDLNTLDMALLDLENAVRLTPNDAELYVMCGEIYLEQGRKREAYVAFEKAIELGVPRPELQEQLKASKGK